MGRRRYPRTDIRYSATLYYADRGYTDCLIRNFSRGGLFLSCDGSELAEVLELGHFSPARRPGIRIVVDEGRLSVRAEIVHVNQAGIGVVFTEAEDALFTFLQGVVAQGSEPIEPSQEVHERSESSGLIVRRLCDKSLDFMKTPLRQFLDAANKDLIEATDSLEHMGDQSDLLFAVTLMESRETEIAEHYISAVAAGFDALMTMPEGTEDRQAPAGVNGTELALVDKQAFDEWVYLDGIAHRAGANVAQQVYQLNAAFAYLVQRPITEESNPVSPISLLKRLQSILEGYDLMYAAKRVIYPAFAHTLLNQIQRLYAELIVCLNEDGVQTGNPEERGPGVLSEGDRQRPGSSSGPAELENLALLLDAAHGPSEPTPSSPYSVASREQVLENLMSLSGGTGLVQQLERRLIDADSQGLSLDPLTRAAVGTGEKLIEVVQQDGLIGRDVRMLVNQMELPFIRESVNDPRILEQTQHPGRRFLEAVERLTPFVDLSGLATGPGVVRHPGLRQLIDDIQSGGVSDIGEATRQIEELTARSQEIFQRNCSLAIENCRRQERLWRMQALVRETLQARLLGQSISRALDRLFAYGWTNLLVQTAVLHGEKSNRYKAYVRAVDYLLKLFADVAPINRLPADKAKDLLKVINKGFKDYPVYPAGAERYKRELQRALVADDANAEVLIQDRLSVDEAYLNRLFQGQSKQPEVDDQAFIDERWMDLVADLGVGEWVQQHTTGENSRLLNLAWKNLQGERYLLVDGSGFKVFYLQARDLACRFADNRLERRKNPDQPIVDRAVERILQRGYDEVRHELSYDELTGVLNRRSFERVLTEMLRGEMMEGERHAMILLDVDQFGLVNDLCGFEGGDKLLQSIANILRTNLPEHSHLARIGDDEFAALMPGNDLDRGFQLAEAQRLAINAFKFTWDKQLIPVSASLGLVVMDSLSHTSAELLKSVSSACAIAKQAGRNCTRVYSATDREFIAHRELVDSVVVIEAALENDKIVLVSQPIVPLREGTGSMHYEVLMRIEGESGELQSPVQFILAAERYNFMRVVDRWVVERFFSIADEHPQAIQEIGGFSINLSSQSVADPAFKTYLIQKIEGSQVARQKLGFEITETAMLKDSKDAVGFIREVREAGCGFYLDDFGSGYASFSYLKEMPVDYVKIDGIFIKDLLVDAASREMVKAVTSISHFMGKQVVAEFVENRQTADLLRTMGVDYIQGYHVGKPVPLCELLALDRCVNQA